MYERIVAVTALLVSLVTAGCHRGGFTNAPEGTQGSVGLVVQNHNFYDTDVYVVSEGLATRIGEVTGNSTAHFVLDPSFFPSKELRIVATPIGGNGRATSGPQSVSPGQTIDFTIAPVLRQSSATIR
ncbi:MAG TPA: hypothetical protein VJN70_19390 [Gemmatimonadaceae bacterium]|nr:hypothetical protein [Gemmatimonadaceae bacterium]